MKARVPIHIVSEIFEIIIIAGFYSLYIKTLFDVSNNQIKSIAFYLHFSLWTVLAMLEWVRRYNVHVRFVHPLMSTRCFGPDT